MKANELNSEMLEALEECEAELDLLLRHPAKHNAIAERHSYIRETIAQARAIIARAKGAE